MITKEELRQYADLVKERDDILERICQKDAAIKSASIQHITGMPRAEGNNVDKIGRAVAQIDSLKELYYTKLQEIEATLFKIEKAISKLDPLERRLIRMRYIDCKAWEDICYELGYAWANTHRIHASVLQKLAKDDTL